MKKIIRLCFAAVAAACVLSCSKNEPEQDSVTISDFYVGTFSVANSDGSTFEVEDVRAKTRKDEATGTVDLMLLGVQFSPKMPVKLDVGIDGIGITGDNGGVLSIAGTDIIPTAMGGPFPQYTVTDLSGSISEKDMNLSMKFGGLASSFKGVPEE